MNLDAALSTIADRFGITDIDYLRRLAAEDDIGGYSSDPSQSRWPSGSIWEVEGKVLYALVRYANPRLILNLGGWKGCSTAHLMAAVAENVRKGGRGRVGSVDLYPEPRTEGDSRFEDRLSRFTMDGVKFVQDMPANEYDFCFEDMMHSTEQVAAVWSAFMQKAPPGSWMISHDSEHTTGQDDGILVRTGIEAVVGDDYLSLLIEPSDCGLAIARRE